MSVRRFRRWTDAETAKARELVHTDIHPDEFRAQVGRTKDAARSRLRWIDDAKYREEHARRWAARQSELPKSFVVVPPKFAPPPEVLADAERRASAPRTLTAMFCQDPEPGRLWPDGRTATQVSA